MYRYLVFVILIYWFSSCQNETNPSFYESYINAQQENKYLWLNLNFGSNAVIQNEIKKYKTSGKAIGDIIFQQYNLLDTSNAFLIYILLTENINNSYILNPQGNIISFSYHKITAEAIKQQLNAIRKNQPELPEHTREFTSTSDSLISLYNLVLKAHFLYHQHTYNTDSLEQALQLLNQSIEIEPYFYNLYLKSKILKIQKDSHALNFARLALRYAQSEYQKQIYALLIEELASDYPIAQQNNGKGIIDFKQTILDAGKLSLNSEYEFNFEFENTGEEPFIITYVSSTCGCATPQWNKKPILPKEKGSIKVIFHAEKQGNFVRSVIVQSTAQNDVVQLLLRGNVSMSPFNQ